MATLPVVSDTPFTELYRMDERSISTVNKGTGSTLIGQAIFAAAIVNLVDFFGDPWTDAQIASATEVFYSECHWFCFGELKHFTRKAKASYFGKIFGKFTPAVLMDWMTTYSTVAWNERGNYFEAKAKKTKWVEPTNIVSPERIKELLEPVKQELTKVAIEQKEKHDLEQRRSAEKAQKNIEAYNNMLQGQINLKSKQKTTNQVPDTCENDIANEQL